MSRLRYLGILPVLLCLVAGLFHDLLSVKAPETTTSFDEVHKNRNATNSQQEHVNNSQNQRNDIARVENATFTPCRNNCTNNETRITNDNNAATPCSINCANNATSSNNDRGNSSHNNAHANLCHGNCTNARDTNDNGPTDINTSNTFFMGINNRTSSNDNGNSSHNNAAQASDTNDRGPMNMNSSYSFFMRMGSMPALDALRTCNPLDPINNVTVKRTRENMLSAFPRLSSETPSLQAFWDFVAQNQMIPSQNGSSIDPHHCQDSSYLQRPQYRFAQKLNTPMHTGLGARMRIMTSSFIYALKRKMTFSVAGPWMWTDGNLCPGRNHECYFLEPGNLCTGMENSSKIVHNEELHYGRALGLFELSQQFQLSPFRINSEALYFLLQPKPSLQQDIEEAARLLDWHRLPHPILTVHIRHGKKSTESQYYPTADYLKAAATMKEQYGFRSVFLITDDKNASDTFAQEIPALGFEALVSLDEPKFAQKGWVRAEANQRDAHQRIKAGNASPCHEAVTALLNVYIGAQTDGFVGTFNSNLGRMIVKLLYARRGSVPPNVSLDQFLTSFDTGSCWHENVCLGRTKVLVKTDSGDYPMSTSIVE